MLWRVYWREIEFTLDDENIQGGTVEATGSEYFLEPSLFQGKLISTMGISFVLPAELGTGASVEFTEVELDEEEGYVTFPAYIKFTLEGEYPDPDFNTEYNLPIMTIYRTDAYEDGYEHDEDYFNIFQDAFEFVVYQLPDLLETRADLSQFDVTENYLPDLSPASVQGTLAHLDYIDFQNGSGFRLVTFYQQDFGSPNNTFLSYRFDGITDDGLYFIVLDMPVDSPRLPELYDRSGEDPSDYGFSHYQSYVDTVDEFLTAIPLEEWTPSLALLDALVHSLVVENVEVLAP